MTTFASLPATARQPQDTQRASLITETSRLAFEIEAAERNAPSLARHGISGPRLLRLRVRFHTRMAELLALTHSWHPEGQARVTRSRCDHLRLSEAYQRELDILEVGRSDYVPESV